MGALMRKRPLLLRLVFTSVVLWAQDWTGAINNNWNDPGNWDQWPLDEENITIHPLNYSGAMLPFQVKH